MAPDLLPSLLSELRVRGVIGLDGGLEHLSVFGGQVAGGSQMRSASSPWMARRCSVGLKLQSRRSGRVCAAGSWGPGGSLRSRRSRLGRRQVWCPWLGGQPDGQPSSGDVVDDGAAAVSFGDAVVDETLVQRVGAAAPEAVRPPRMGRTTTAACRSSKAPRLARHLAAGLRLRCSGRARPADSPPVRVRRGFRDVGKTVKRAGPTKEPAGRKVDNEL